MSPRGVAIPDLRERLFAAAERVVARDGAAALTSRAVTAEAECAKGVLHTHFSGIDEFVAELVLDRFARSARFAEELASKAGRGTVEGNLAEVALALLNSLDPAIAGLAMTRPGASLHTRRALESGSPGFAAMQESVTAYLEAERLGGRIAPDADAATLSLALIGTVHHLLLTGGPGPAQHAETAQPAGETIRRLTAVLLGGARHDPKETA
ncbi:MULTISPECIES: TetR family transcriptional regulator [unclassified Streptomyces]|uniref:TetR family transcriptional regulator n=1 Tax=unclassified Streptomyces TaxID=2593676 RepID=UPI000DC7CB38|nr:MULTISPECIES: TetR family transcriptional regulator [unclassified Streptomyces]AWZ08783.1 TetR/AcrR family transcriptional regulator [Streptomyces sp. ICC4]AWZ16034.1 TetR/AcrR family transcriptional regulator [Streptomyces sp. ICC1]